MDLVRIISELKNYRSPRIHNESGMTTISYVLATGLSLIVISWCMMFVVMSYARASVRGAASRGSRAGAVAYTNTRDTTFAAQECIRVFDEDLESALPQSVRSSISNTCKVENETLRVHTSGSLRSITILIPAFSISETTRRKLEVLP